jgi:hypothetical protein
VFAADIFDGTPKSWFMKERVDMQGVA